MPLFCSLYTPGFRVNTFASKINVGDMKYHAVHEYNDTLKNIYLDDFQASVEYMAFRKRTGREKIGYTKFKEGALQCKCIKKPTMRVCVDEIETEFTEITSTLKTIRRTSVNRGEICNCAFCTYEEEKKKKLGDGKL